ncbi:hypothetical protein PIB30_017290 [Stylosanthes scabra]|uniref:Cytochrome b561 domain-containing protein n=1 Tax=Stylosanthes scabra TaxID=79078 RepID=A0ABU6R7W3_9FABA|nr:hypothetical protein [Stylosanthes scabra]
MSSYGTQVLAHLFGILAIILLLVWLLHYCEGIDYGSDIGLRVFNVHPLMMFMGFIFISGEAILSFQTIPSQRQTKKFFHMMLHLISLILGIVGLCATFKFHNMMGFPNVYSLHSWIGIGSFCLFGLQWLIGFVTFMFPSAADRTRVRVVPWHVAGGRALLFMAVCAAETGLMEKYGFLRAKSNLQPHQRESHLINFTGLAILLFAVFVDLSVSIRRYSL